MVRVPIRMKLTAALAVPLIGLLVVTALEVRVASDAVAEVRDQVALAETALGPSSVLSAIEEERNAAGVYLLGQEDAFVLEVEDNAEARGLSDEAITTFRAVVEQQDPAVAAAYAPAFDVMQTLDALRAEVDATPDANRTLRNIDAVSENFAGYSAIMDSLATANRQVALEVDDPQLRQGVELVDMNSQQTDLVAKLVRDQLLAQVGGAAPNGVDTAAEVDVLASNVGQLRANYEDMASSATGEFVPLVQDLLGAEVVVRFPEVVDQSIATGQVDIASVIAFSAGDDAETLAYSVFGDEVKREVRERADELTAAAEARQRWFLVLAVSAITIAGVVTWLVSRSITKPLRSLTRQAKEMAERRLPDAVIDILETPLGDDVQVPTVDPVVVHTRDEVADVSIALNTVQDTALDLAVEQAVLRRNIADSFVNLGRRNQNLLGRQLDFITELETNETSPDALSNLFRLDHLATRMRRNAESLLVLAGIEPPRQWAAPVRLTDVIRAALGEVEDYQRVTVRGVEPATIIGSAAADLAHLLAELIENALVFSPPDQTVDIRGRQNPHGYTLAVIDSGLGMPQADITSANRRLAGAESFTIAPSKYLGHYVAGNLAARHNIQVTLDNSPGNGITATIDLPPTLLTTEQDLAPEVTPPHGHRPVLPGGPRRPGAVPVPAGPFSGPSAPSPGPHVPAGGPTAIPPVPDPVVGRRTESGLVMRRPQAVARGGPPLGATPDRDLLASLARVTGPPTRPPQAPPPPRPPVAPAAWPPAPVPGGPPPETAGGLTRRVRGAQIPTTEPIALRRSPGPAAVEPTPWSAPPAAGPPVGVGHAGDQPRSADAVYSLLTAFTNGVQRGFQDLGRAPDAHR